MAHNFRISKNRKGNSLHLQLAGNFDGSSAMELIYAIVEHADTVQTIFIETDGLNALLPFGRQVFLKKSFLSSEAFQKLVFTGSHARKLISDKSPAM